MAILSITNTKLIFGTAFEEPNPDLHVNERKKLTQKTLRKIQ
jgi:hypothetical protein